jgi:tRNA threonylcarbamoyl adenosine modification protein (Sua5/YciO/YrdC/YwlC family)
MNIIKVNLENPEDDIVCRIAKELSSGKVVALPFDTSYGLAVDAANTEAVRYLYLVKGRKEQKAISIAVRDYAMLEQVAEVPSDELRKFILSYVPGPVTIVLKARKETRDEIGKMRVSDRLLAEDGTIGVRIVKSRLIGDVLWKFGRPITSTSANVAGQPACFSADEVIKQFGSRKYKPDLVVDGGKLAESKMSTVVLATVWPPLVLRQGEVVIKEAE